MSSSRTEKEKQQSKSTGKKDRPKSKSAAYFIKKFVLHFHPETGKFNENTELRLLIYNQLIEEVKKGTNYKSLWRLMMIRIHPDKAAFGRLTREECETVFKYFSNNFDHFDDVKL